MKLTDEDVNDLLRILDANDFAELHLETRDLKLSVRRGADGHWTQSQQIRHPPHVRHLDEPPGERPAQTPAGELDTPGRVPVRAPLPGTFYRAPSPGAAPFVAPGDRVEPDTVVAIVETMKLMNPVYAGARGRIAEICRDNGAAVEQGSVLLLVESEAAAS